jgi:hypothetical protein
MAAYPNKAVSPKDYTVCVGKKVYTDPLSYSLNGNSYSNIFDLTSTYNAYNLPSYGIVGEFIFTYPELIVNTSRSIYIYCKYKINSDFLYKCRYIRLVITPNISCYNSTTSTINVFFNVAISLSSTFEKNVNVSQFALPVGGSVITRSTKFAVIYDLKKNVIYKDTDDPIKQWSDSYQLSIY